MDKHSKVTLDDLNNSKVSIKKNIEHYSKMTFRELKNELSKFEQNNANNNNDEKIKIIRKIMYQRYQDHMSKKKSPNNIIINSSKKSHIQDNRIHDNEYSRESNNLDFLDDDYIKNDKKYNGLYEQKVTNNPLEDIGFNSRPNYEYDRDKLNNNLTDRLNNDLDIYNIKSKKNIKDMVLVPPFSNGPGNKYASIDEQKNVINFSNI